MGDIVISVPYAARSAAAAGHRDRVAAALGVDAATLSWGLREELEFLVIHGLLHLLGHDHAEPAEEARMREAERELWLASR